MTVAASTMPTAYRTPTKAILSKEQLAAFESTPTHTAILTYIETLNSAVVNVKLTADCSQSPGLDAALKHRVSATLHSRHDRVLEESVAIHETLPDLPKDAIQELKAYFEECWGSRSRIDYGSGMELNFLCWMLCLERLGVFKDSDHIALVTRVFLELDTPGTWLMRRPRKQSERHILPDTGLVWRPKWQSGLESIPSADTCVVLDKVINAFSARLSYFRSFVLNVPLEEVNSDESECKRLTRDDLDKLKELLVSTEHSSGEALASSDATVQKEACRLLGRSASQLQLTRALLQYLGTTPWGMNVPHGTQSWPPNIEDQPYLVHLEALRGHFS
ncbi:unnamed protein product [Peniophora sp. CBMAI 1063]|nr:unnamed protein product [Peniophora sp. CBMAI 1063]